MAATSAQHLLTLVNERGEIGYAFGGAETDYRFVEECIENGWIVFSHDASVGGGRFDDRPYQKRSIYRITEKGRQALKEGQP